LDLKCANARFGSTRSILTSGREGKIRVIHRRGRAPRGFNQREAAEWNSERRTPNAVAPPWLRWTRKLDIKIASSNLKSQRCASPRNDAGIVPSFIRARPNVAFGQGLILPNLSFTEGHLWRRPTSMSLHPVLAEKLSVALGAGTGAALTLRDTQLPVIQGKAHPHGHLRGQVFPRCFDSTCCSRGPTPVLAFIHALPARRFPADSAAPWSPR